MRLLRFYRVLLRRHYFHLLSLNFNAHYKSFKYSDGGVGRQVRDALVYAAHHAETEEEYVYVAGEVRKFVKHHEVSGLSVLQDSRTGWLRIGESALNTLSTNSQSPILTGQLGGNNMSPRMAAFSTASKSTNGALTAVGSSKGSRLRLRT
jgi:hypothetical protein